jgi:hypothetical protein
MGRYAEAVKVYQEGVRFSFPDSFPLPLPPKSNLPKGLVNPFAEDPKAVELANQTRVLEPLPVPWEFNPRAFDRPTFYVWCHIGMTRPEWVMGIQERDAIYRALTGEKPDRARFHLFTGNISEVMGPRYISAARTAWQKARALAVAAGNTEIARLAQEKLNAHR